ncbi:MAG: DUF4278 domain-containing protein [Pseudomonadota bacterium]
MTKLTYRGVSYDSAQKPKNAHQHASGLKYRGVSYDGEEAAKNAQAVPAGHKKIYRSAVAQK